MSNPMIRASIRSFYDLQQLRIQNGNRIAAAFRVKLGLHSSQAEEEVKEPPKYSTICAKNSNVSPTE